MKQALVTGGANGIGRGIVEHLLAEGWAVRAVDSDAGALAALDRHDLLDRVEADVSDEAAVAGAGLDRLDLAVSNAGIANPETGPIEELELADWNRRIAVNLTGGFLVAKHCAPLLRAARGALVFMASTRAFMSEPDTEAYAATKGGLVALSHALAISLGPEVRVNAIAPGWIATERDAAAPPSGGGGWGMPPSVFNRMGTPAEIAAAVLFLASDEASFVTGQTLIVDGGLMVLDYPSMEMLKDAGPGMMSAST